MLMNFVSPSMIVLFFEGRLKETLEAFAGKLECSISDLTIFFKANKKEEIIARVIYQKKKVEDIPILPVFEQAIRGVLARVPDAMLNLVDDFQKDFGKDLEEAFANKKATNQAVAELINGDTLIVKYKGGAFVYAQKKKEGGRAKQVELSNHLTKENFNKVVAQLKTEEL